MKTTYKLLVVAIIALLIGLVLNTGSFHLHHAAAAFYVILPVGSIFLGLFLMFRVFEAESEACEQDSRRALKSRPLQKH